MNSQIPSDLPSRQEVAPWLTPLTLAIIVIAAIVAVVIGIGIAVCLYKRIGFNYQMIEQKSVAANPHEDISSSSSDSD